MTLASVLVYTSVFLFGVWCGVVACIIGDRYHN